MRSICYRFFICSNSHSDIKSFEGKDDTGYQPDIYSNFIKKTKHAKKILNIVSPPYRCQLLLGSTDGEWNFPAVKVC